MAIHAGRHQFGMDKGHITLRTFRDGLVAQAGHDLTIEVARWSADLVVSADLAPASLKVNIDLGSLLVRDGTGGLKPLTDRDKREIAVTARNVLKADRFPRAEFNATEFQRQPDTSDGSPVTGGTASDSAGTVRGTLSLAGQTGPVELNVLAVGSGQYQATTTIRQTDFGIKPYSAFLGSLKVRDVVTVEVQVDLSTAEDQESAA
jgi:polyisoprenoid-binding protein YceI